MILITITTLPTQGILENIQCLPNLGCASESPGKLLKMQIPGPRAFASVGQAMSPPSAPASEYQGGLWKWLDYTSLPPTPVL